MIGSIFRSKKIFILLVMVVGIVIYTFMNRDLIRGPSRQHYVKQDDIQNFLTDSNKGQRNTINNEMEPNNDSKTDAKSQQHDLSDNQHVEFYVPTETTPTQHTTDSSNEEKKFEVEWDKEEERENNHDKNDSHVHEDGGIHIKGPHHYPSITFPHSQMATKYEKTFKFSKPVTQTVPNAGQEEEIGKPVDDPEESHKNDHSIPVVFYTTAQPNKELEMLTENSHLNKEPIRLISRFDRNVIKNEHEGNAHSGKNSNDNEGSDKQGTHKTQKNKSVLKSLLNDKQDPDIPPYNICPFLGLRSSKHHTNTILNGDVQPKCYPKTPTQTSCKEAYVAYEVNVQPLKCESLQGNTNKICSFDEDGKIHCDMSLCGERYVQLASVDPSYGIVREAEARIFIGSNKELQSLVYDYSKLNKYNGFNFCFLKCKSKSKAHPYIEQLVVFPPVVPNGPALDPPLININVVLLDSVSRPHFYRSLQKSVQSLRKIIHDPNLDATVLDYELFQSMADYTFHNVRVFMSGKTDFQYKEHQDQHYEIEYLFRIMKSKGYHTLLQEDSCWFDEWGSLYTDNLFQGRKPQDLEDFKSRWHAFKENVKHYYIDDYGLSHFSCEVLQRYNITNQFNQPRKICFGGKVFAEYFLDYIEEVFTRNQKSKRPILAYTHLNTGHEVSGTRIKQLDERLSEFFLNMAKQQNTLTLVFSDHGPKTTQYAFRKMEGRAEIYDSLMFVILPEKVASFLGYKRTKALITNQKRLITALDLHNTMMSIDDKNRAGSGSPNLEGIFAEVSLNRTCADLLIKTSAICKCDGWDETFPNNHPPFVWLAELALGTLNNRIQNEYTQGMEGKGGYGKCQRLIGKRFEKIRRRSVGNKYKVTMDIIVYPEAEIFETQIEYPMNPSSYDNNVTMTHLSRISIYRRFEKCKDETVDLTICVCKSRKSSNTRSWVAMDSRKNLLRVLTRSTSFGAQLKFTDLHVSCLVMVTRSESSRTSVFEIANACTNRSYRVKITGKSRGKAMVSTKFPLTLQVEPLTVHFLFSVYHLERPYGFKTTTSYKAHFVDMNE